MGIRLWVFTMLVTLSIIAGYEVGHREDMASCARVAKLARTTLAKCEAVDVRVGELEQAAKGRGCDTGATAVAAIRNELLSRWGECKARATDPGPLGDDERADASLLADELWELIGWIDGGGREPTPKGTPMERDYEASEPTPKEDT